MKKFMTGGAYFEKYEDAEVAAKKYASVHKQDYGIYERIATAKTVIPDIEIVKEK